MKKNETFESPSVTSCTLICREIVIRDDVIFIGRMNTWRWNERVKKKKTRHAKRHPQSHRVIDRWWDKSFQKEKCHFILSLACFLIPFFQLLSLARLYLVSCRQVKPEIAQKLRSFVERESGAKWPLFLSVSVSVCMMSAFHDEKKKKKETARTETYNRRKNERRWSLASDTEDG